MLACVIRTAIFDQWIAAFLQSHPAGTVVEIGAGLNTRFERLDNGRIHWFDLDLPGVVELRRRFFRDSPRRRTLAASVLDSDWTAAVRQSPGPYFFVAETVFVYLQEAEVRTALANIRGSFPSSAIAFDTAAPQAIRRGNRDFARRNIPARFTWSCPDPHEIERWNLGLHLVESCTLLDVPEPLIPRLPLSTRLAFRAVRRFFPEMMKVYQLHLFNAPVSS